MQDVNGVTTGLTAATTQTQGAGIALTTEFNVVTTCANANDAATLPPAVAGRRVTVCNRGAQTLQLFPASGDAIDAGAGDASTTITAASKKTFIAVDATTWYTVA